MPALAAHVASPNSHRGPATGVQARPGTCGCPYPLIWDRNEAIWRHLADGSPCLPRATGSG